MKIVVADQEGERIELLVNKTDTVASVKAQILEKKGIPVAEQELSFGGRTLDDGACVPEIGGAQLSLFDKTKMQLFVKLPGGQTITVWARQADTVAALKAKISRKTGMLVDS